MLKRVIGGLFAIGVVAILTSEAGAGCVGFRTSTGAYQLYCTGSVICDLGFKGGSPKSTAHCDVTITANTPILLLCSNQGGTIAPGGNVQLANPAVFGAAAPATVDKKTGQNTAVLTVDLTPENGPLDEACKQAFNENWFAANAVPCISSNKASLVSPNGHTESVTSHCTLPVQQCDSTQTEVLDFNKKTGAFEQINYVCTNE